MINFKELKETNVEMYLNTIKLDSLKVFTEKALAQHGTHAKLKKANKVADIVWQKFEHAGYISEQVQQQFVDITISACLLYNLFYKEDDVTTILAHRVKLAGLVEELGLDDRLIALVYEIIEGQLGESSTVAKLKPVPNSPASTFAEAVWQVNTYKSRL